MSDPEWRQFESAVASFLAALDPSAKVTKDVQLPDRDTGYPRQRDVWIEGMVCRLFPVKILVSCKHTASKLDQQDIDAFLGELRSSGAHKGVLYSRSGYTGPALKKADKHGVSCCRLYQNEPPKLPQHLFFKVYCLWQQVGVSIVDEPAEVWSISTWGDLFATQLNDRTVLDAIVSTYQAEEQDAADRLNAHGDLRHGWSRELTVTDAHRPEMSFRVRVGGWWKAYIGKLAAHLINGSYSETDKLLVGTISCPVIDRRGPHPGKGWTLLESPPARMEPPCIYCVMRKPNIRTTLIDALGDVSIRDALHVNGDPSGNDAAPNQS